MADGTIEPDANPVQAEQAAADQLQQQALQWLRRLVGEETRAQFEEGKRARRALGQLVVTAEQQKRARRQGEVAAWVQLIRAELAVLGVEPRYV